MRVSSSEVWEQALASLPHPHPLQSWPWADFKSRWGWSFTAFLLKSSGEERDRPRAAAMVLKRRLPRSPFSILYVPKGPLFNHGDAATATAIVDQLEVHARNERAIFIKIDPEVVSGHGVDDPEPTSEGRVFKALLEERDWRFSDDQIQYGNTVELDLTLPEEELLARMKQKTRYNIRLAGRRDVEIRAGSPADFELLATMYLETANRDGFAARPAPYYLDAWRTFHAAGMSHLLIAEYEGQPLGAVFIVRLAGRAIYMYGASTTAERRRMPNYLLQWEAIRWARDQGCSVYDFWGAPDEFVESDPLWGVWRFKSGFNGQVVRHVGAWDYPARPFWYWVYSVIIPRYLDFLRDRAADVGRN